MFLFAAQITLSHLTMNSSIPVDTSEICVLNDVITCSVLRITECFPWHVLVELYLTSEIIHCSIGISIPVLCVYQLTYAILTSFSSYQNIAFRKYEWKMILLDKLPVSVQNHAAHWQRSIAVSERVYVTYPKTYNLHFFFFFWFFFQ